MKRGTLAAGLAAVIMWGLAPVATRAAVAHLSPLPLLTLRMTAATLVLLPWAVPLFRRLRVRSAGRLAAAGPLRPGGYHPPGTPGLRRLPAGPACGAWTAVGTLPYLAFAGMLPGAGLGHLGAAVWGELAFLALGSTAAGMLLWNVAVLSGGAARVSLLLYLEPVVSVLGAAVCLGERVTAVPVGGGVLIMGGVAVASSVAAGGIARTFGKIKNIIQNGLAAFR